MDAARHPTVHRAAPQLRPFPPSKWKMEAWFGSNVSSFRFWVSAACSAPQAGTPLSAPQRHPELGRGGSCHPGCHELRHLTSRCDLTSVAPGRDLSDAIGTALPRAPSNPLGKDVGALAAVRGGSLGWETLPLQPGAFTRIPVIGPASESLGPDWRPVCRVGLPRQGRIHS